MKNKYNLFCEQIEKNKQAILDAERYIWKNPETGYKEWKTHAFLKEQFEKLGYTLHEAGDIPGFYTDLDTGKPGPTVAVFGELDSLIVPTHPECDPKTHAVHACGHCCQTASLYGLAVALKAPGALDGMCGKIRLIAVPAEELIELEYRQGLKDKGIIKYFGGKVEFLYRGYLDGVDITFMIHTSPAPGLKGRLHISKGCNGCIVKTYEFKGKASHAGGSPHNGRNALYAATTALSAANALRETFRDSDHIRFHPIITEGGLAVNSIPEMVKVESYVRGATNEAIDEANDKVNRAFAGSAAAMGCGLWLNDVYGYMPLNNDKTLTEAFAAVGSELLGKENVIIEKDNWSSGCTDMGDISSVIPSIHPNVGGASGTSHGADYYITDPESAVILCAKFYACFLDYLLADGAAQAKSVIENSIPLFKSKEEYFAAVDSHNKQQEAVKFNEDGTITLNYK